MTIKEIKKHLTRNKMLTSTLLQIVQEFEREDNQRVILHYSGNNLWDTNFDKLDTLSFIFEEDNKPDKEIMFFLNNGIAEKIEDTFNV